MPGVEEVTNDQVRELLERSLSTSEVALLVSNELTDALEAAGLRE
jgi:hypothetical protein